MDLDYDFKINIKKGDKIFCKKNILQTDKKPVILSGKTYEVLSANNLWIEILGESGMKINISISVFSSASPFMYYDYFYTVQELRKLKLDKLK